MKRYKQCVSYKRKPRWEQYLDIGDHIAKGLPPSHIGVQPLSTKQRSDMHKAVGFLQDFQLVCPQCKHAKLRFGLPFTRGKWKHISCSHAQCNHVSSAKNWLCSCGCLWFGCRTHCKWYEHAYTYSLYYRHVHQQNSNVSKRKGVNTSVAIPVLDGLVKLRRSRRAAPLASASSPASACLAGASRVTSASPKALSANRGGTQTTIVFQPRHRDVYNQVETCSSRSPTASYVSSSAVTSHEAPDMPPRTGAHGTPGHASSGKTSPHASSQGAGTYRPCKRKEQEPYAPPSAELLAKLAAKFPRLNQPRTGDG